MRDITVSVGGTQKMTGFVIFERWVSFFSLCQCCHQPNNNSFKWHAFPPKPTPIKTTTSTNADIMMTLKITDKLLIFLSLFFQAENIRIFPITIASKFVTLSWNTSGSSLLSTRNGYILQVKRKNKPVTSAGS